MNTGTYTDEPNACGLESESEESLSRAAAFLDVSEYRVLEIAYPSWFGRQAESGTIEHAFDEYLERGVIPFWARFFIRSLMDRTEESGCLVRIIEVEPPELTVPQKVRGAGLLLLILLLLALFCFVVVRYPSY
jgi:hypothetical protein